MNFLSRNRYILLLTIIYFLLRLPNLTLLPIFNDEGIYLNWGWQEITVPGNLFYSLYDGKQPLLMWLFGISMHFFPDALLAGRFVSVIAGYITLLGIYKIGKDFFSQKIGNIACGLYIVIPLFAFFDRQALMESAIGSVGIWALYFTLKIVAQPEVIKYQLLLGVTLGLGLLIKTNAILFFVATTISMFIVIKQKQILTKHATKIIFHVALTLLATSSILLIQPQFWSSLGLNSRYSLTIVELLRFPIFHFLSNLLINIQITLTTLTPLVVVGVGYALHSQLRNKNNNEMYIVALWFITLLILQTLLVRESSQRYLVSILPATTLLLAYVLYKMKNYSINIFITFIVFILPTILLVVQLLSPITYFTFLDRFMNYSDKGVYVSSANSGYGINDVVSYIKEISNKKKIYVATAVNTGNPESAIRAYFAKSATVSVLYFDRQLFAQEIDSFDCIHMNKEFYFISRDEQQAGLNKFFTNVTQVKNPYGDNTIGIYTLKKPCLGKKLEIDMQSLTE